MKMSKEGLAELAGHEGICLSKYLDSVGVWTIGVGATRSEIPDLAKWPLDKTISVEEAFELLKKSIVKYENAINKSLKVEVSQTVFDSLVSWCYNVGVGWPPKSTIIKLINNNVKDGTQLRNALLMYNKPKEIYGRRNKEALLLVTGKYQNGGRALLFPVSKKGYPIYKEGKVINVMEYLKEEKEEENSEICKHYKDK